VRTFVFSKLRRVLIESVSIRMSQESREAAGSADRVEMSVARRDAAKVPDEIAPSRGFRITSAEFDPPPIAGSVAERASKKLLA